MQKHDTIVAELFVHNGIQALEFYTQAFGAIEQSRMMGPDGKKLLHGDLEILGHHLVVCDEFDAVDGGTAKCPRTLGGTGVRLILQVEDADRAFAQALAAGATAMIPVEDMFWGARYGKLMDPFGHEWGINQQIEQLSPQQENEGAKRYFTKR